MSGRSGASDERGRLVSDPFEFRVAKDGAVLVSRGGRVGTTVGGSAAARLVAGLERAEAAGDELAAQHLLARVTGNYRRGNERR